MKIKLFKIQKVIREKSDSIIKLYNANKFRSIRVANMINLRNKIDIVYVFLIIVLILVIPYHEVFTLEINNDEILIQKQMTLFNNHEKESEENSNFFKIWKMIEFFEEKPIYCDIDKENDESVIRKKREINQRIISNEIKNDVNILNDLKKNLLDFLTNKIDRNINEKNDSNDLRFNRNIRSINKTDYYAQRKAVMDKYHARQHEITTKYKKRYYNNTTEIVHNKKNLTLNDMNKILNNTNRTLNLDIFKLNSNNSSSFGIKLNNSINRIDKNTEMKRFRIKDNNLRDITNYTTILNNKINLNEDNTEKKRSWISDNSLRDITNYTSELNNKIKQENTDNKGSWINENSLGDVTNYSLPINHNCTNITLNTNYSKQTRNQLTVTCLNTRDGLVVKKSNELSANRPIRATDGNLIWGTCNGTLVYQHNLSLNLHGPSTLEALFEVIIEGPYCITCITILPYNGTKENALKDSGGQGYNYVKIKLIGSKNEGFSYIIKIWAVVKTGNNCE